MAIQSDPKHLLLIPMHFWGHVRPLAVLAVRMVRMRPVVITLCATNKLYEKAKVEMYNELGQGEEELLKRIRLLRIEEGSELLDPGVFRDNFLTSWGKLCSGQSIKAESVDGTPQLINIFDSPLSAVVIDAYAVEIFDALHEQRTKSSIPLHLNLYSYCPVSTNVVVARYRQNAFPIVQSIAAREGLTVHEVAVTMLGSPKGNVIESPCLPAMYDHEFEPQAFSFPSQLLSRVFLKAANAFGSMDGMITFDAAEYHPEATVATREFLAQRNIKGYYAGPLIVDKTRSAYARRDGKRPEELLKFMDKQLRERGEHSVVYISFGSLFWPTDPAKVVAAFEALMQQNIPIIIARSSPTEAFPQDLIDRLSKYPHGFIGGWMPQQTVLEHPATGWCLTHGGHNTVLECIYSGVPMIVWPIAVDQSTNAVHLTHNLDIAYELLQVRNGHGLGPIHRMPSKKLLGTIDAVRDELRDVLVQAFGADGAAKRARVEVLRDTLRGAWGENGVARTETEAFLDSVCALQPSTLADAQTALQA
ncbi:UDP-Glycosyltransferase/glycogen phosphorylase [Cubamyces sp. BRFM 1775]|nr:UDP-Glycosyltransferase/glycogen phosphorylase [Cubamyces sp. BRFM 1775]